jgi:hypothetical protein
MTHVLTPDQDSAFAAVKAFFSDQENPAIIIIGSAGTGKTYLTGKIADYIIESGISVGAIAPTHKAKRVLSKMLNTDRFLNIPSFTVASVLGKMREHSYIGSHKYTSGNTQKMDKYDCFILDEVSMVCDKDLDEIIDYVCDHDKKLILVGDNCQIPAPSQALVRDNGVCYKPDSTAFDIENQHCLKTIVRQASDSPIIRIASYLRDHLNEQLELSDIFTGSCIDPGDLTITHATLYLSFRDDWRSGKDTRIIAYTNSAVHNHNTQVRKILNISDTPLVVGELLTGYGNVGWPEPMIENGTDYIVKSLSDTVNYNISDYSGLVGKLTDLEDIDDKTLVSRGLFFVNVKHTANRAFMQELTRRAEKVNQRFSTKDDYRKYCSLKNRAIFLENVYKYRNTIATESDFKHSHPLLFTKVSDAIDVCGRTVFMSELSKKLEDQYGDIATVRLKDNKPFADSETFADQYTVVEKDIYYGYSLTAHKCQGSTYHCAYVDEHDFKKISSKWNHRLGLVEQRHKEQNQLKYVAYTRASEKLRLIV